MMRPKGDRKCQTRLGKKPRVGKSDLTLTTDTVKQDLQELRDSGTLDSEQRSRELLNQAELQAKRLRGRGKKPTTVTMSFSQRDRKSLGGCAGPANTRTTTTHPSRPKAPIINDHFKSNILEGDPVDDSLTDHTMGEVWTGRERGGAPGIVLDPLGLDESDSSSSEEEWYTEPKSNTVVGVNCAPADYDPESEVVRVKPTVLNRDIISITPHLNPRHKTQADSSCPFNPPSKRLRRAPDFMSVNDVADTSTQYICSTPTWSPHLILIR